MRQFLSATALAASLALTGLAGVSSAAQAQDVFQSILRTIGVGGEDDPLIEYRDRAPLVVPNSTDSLPAPRDMSDVERTANWPKDPDTERRKQAMKDAQTPIDIRRGRDPGQPLTRDELRRGTVPGRAVSPADKSYSADTRGDAMLPSDIGPGHKSLFSGMFDKGKGKSEVAPPEPERTSLTEPPAGLRTASPNQPYRAPKETGLFKVPDFYERTAK